MTANTTSHRLSIIIPSLDEEAALTTTLPGLADLRRAGHEVILVDGGSRDDTLRRARTLVDKVVCAERGRARQMNAGAGVAGGDVLLFLHADTVLPPAADRCIAAALVDGDRHWGRFDVRLGGQEWWLRIIERLMSLRSRVTGIATGDQAIFVHRQVFEAVAGYPDIPLMEDVALSRRLKAVSPPACLSARVVTSARRWRERGVLRTVMLMWRLRLEFAFGADPKRLARLYQRG